LERYQLRGQIHSDDELAAPAWTISLVYGAFKSDI